MPQPQAYERQTDFTERDGDDTDHAALNQELDAAALSIEGIRDNLALIQRDDGALKNGIVTPDSLAPETFTALQGDVADAVADAQAAATSALTSATTANNAAVQAATSATAAQTSQTAAALNATTASTAAAAASASQVAAAASAAAALASANGADVSEAAALVSQNAAAASAAAALADKNAAAASAAAALASENGASASATTATTQAGIATTGAGTATTQAAIATTKAADAAASAASINLPVSLVGKLLNFLRVKADESGYEHRTAVQVRGDIGAAASGANGDITSLTGLTSLLSVPPMTVFGGAVTRMAIGAGLNANLLATAIPVRLSFPGGIGANGRTDYPGSIIADAAAFWPALTASSTLYTFYDRDVGTGAITGVFSTLPYIYQDSSVAVSVVNGQHTYVTDTNTMYVGNGATATVVQRIPEGELVTSGAAVTSVTSYAKLGFTGSVISADAPFPSLAGSANFVHNIGVLGAQSTVYARCNITGGAGTAGQIFANPMTQSGTAYGVLQAKQTSRISSSITVGNSAILVLTDASGGGMNAQTSGNYALFMVTRRPF